MYLTWIKCETKKVLKLGVRIGNNILSRNKHLVLNEIDLPPKWVASNMKLGEVGVMPPQWPGFAKQKDICIISIKWWFFIYSKENKGKQPNVLKLSIFRGSSCVQFAPRRRWKLLPRTIVPHHFQFLVQCKPILVFNY